MWSNDERRSFAGAQDDNWRADGDTPVHSDSRINYLVDGRTALYTMCLHFLKAGKYIYPADWGMTPGIELVRGTDHRRGPGGVGLRLMGERAEENLQRYKAKQPLIGHLLPYLTGAEATQQGLPVREDHGWLEE